MSIGNFNFRVMLAGFVALATAALAAAHDQIPGAPQTRPIALVGGTIHTVDGPIIDGGTVVFDEGKITAVGKNVPMPRSCQSIDVSGQHVYPGLIESMSNIGLIEIGSVRATIDTDEVGDENENIRPWVAVNPDSELIPVARAGGVLLASIAPQRGDLRGQVDVIELDGWTNGDMLLRENVGLAVSWRAFDSRNRDDSDRAKQRDERLKRLSDRLDAAKRYTDSRATDPENTPVDIRLEALATVAEGSTPMIVLAETRREIESAVAFCVTREIPCVIYGGYDAPQCATLLKKYGIPVIVHGTYRLPLRRHEPYDHPYTLPKRLHDAGVRFAIGGPGSGSPGGASAARNLPYHAAVAVAYGLPTDQAVRAVTLAPAEILGIGDRVGSISAEKDATLIVVDGDVLQTESNVSRAYIAGAEVDLGSKHKTLADKYRLKYKRAGR